MRTATADRIRAALDGLDLMTTIEEGFVEYSDGRAVVPPVGELILDRGEVHIKYGFVRGDEYYVIKVASGFFGNSARGLPSGNGLMLVFRQDTGVLERILLDEGHLTDVRTAVAGAVAAKHLAPVDIERIGIVGTGLQARLQLYHLETVTACRDVLVWGRGEQQVDRYRNDVRRQGFSAEGTKDADDVLRSCNLVVTTTPSSRPLLHASALNSGTHITAVGSDTADKQELESAILARANVVVADSIEQCRKRGEIHRAIADDAITGEHVLELGDVIANRSAGRVSQSDITVADLTGVAVQDIRIATAVLGALDADDQSEDRRCVTE